MRKEKIDKERKGKQLRMAMTQEKKTQAEANKQTQKNAINRQIDTKQLRCQRPPYDRHEERNL